MRVSATTQMAACRLARREPSKYANAALQSLAREGPFPTACALPWRIWEVLKPQNKVKRGTWLCFESVLT